MCSSVGRVYRLVMWMVEPADSIAKYNLTNKKSCFISVGFDVIRKVCLKQSKNIDSKTYSKMLVCVDTVIKEKM